MAVGLETVVAAALLFVEGDGGVLSFGRIVNEGLLVPHSTEFDRRLNQQGVSDSKSSLTWTVALKAGADWTIDSGRTCG